MAKIERKALTLFGNTGDTSAFARFGSDVAGAPYKTKDILDIQSLPAWATGLSAALVAATKTPFMEDFNSLFYVLCYQMVYGLQEGIAEYNASTTYYIGSIVKKTGTSQLYKSKTDINVNNALTDTSNWLYLGDLSALGNASIPPGLISMWSGTLANIPSGWILCDGNNSTPDLHGKFIRGINTNVTDPGTPGGAATVSLSAGNLPTHTHDIAHSHSGVTVDIAHTHGTHDHKVNTNTGFTGNEDVTHTHTVTINAIPDHVHDLKGVTVNLSGGGIPAFISSSAGSSFSNLVKASGTYIPTTDTVGNSSISHKHSVSIDQSDSITLGTTYISIPTITLGTTSSGNGTGTLLGSAFSILPPYYELAFIMKL